MTFKLFIYAQLLRYELLQAIKRLHVNTQVAGIRQKIKRNTGAVTSRIQIPVQVQV